MVVEKKKRLSKCLINGWNNSIPFLLSEFVMKMEIAA